MNHKNTTDTICAIATPKGVGAIAIIRLSGENSIKIVNKIFSKEITNVKGYSVHYGTISENQQVVDDVLVTVFRAPHSFTGENSVEIACHGSSYIQQKIIEIVLRNGARPASPGEFSQRAFFNGKFDLTQTEAIADLIHAQSEAAHRLAMQQMKGGVSNQLKELRQKMMNFASLIELELDFSEEDVEFADRKELISLVTETIRFVQKLKNTFKLGNAIKNGVQTTIVGRPNAGKSTLLNSLLDEERAIVSNIAGTTRDTIEETLNINGILFRFIDTAGLRETSDEIEKQGVEKALEKVNLSAIYIYLFDADKTDIKEVEKDLSLFPKGISNLIVANKADLISKERKTELIQHFGDDLLLISAKENKSIQKLKDKLLNVIDADRLNSGDVIITNTRHVDALEQAELDLQKTVEGLQQNIPGDLIAMDIRQALYHLGSITGEVTGDDLLGNIFANFCIGK